MPRGAAIDSARRAHEAQQQQQRRQQQRLEARRFYVREIPWSSRDTDAIRKKWARAGASSKLEDEERGDSRAPRVASAEASRSEAGGGTSSPPPPAPPPVRFGVVAAMSRNRIIGVGGSSLPWETVREDRERFVRLTERAVVIVGRKTWDERSDRSHLSHARRCVVVTSSADPEDLIA